AVVEVGEPLEVEEEVAVVGVRQAVQAMSLAGGLGEEGPGKDPVGAAADLLGGLLLQPAVGAGPDGQAGRRGGGCGGEGGDGGDAGAGQPVDLLPADAGDEGQVVVGPAAVGTPLVPPAQGAVFDGVRVGRNGVEGGGEADRGGPEVGGDGRVGEPPVGAVAEGQHQPLRVGALQRGEEVAVEGHLEEGGGSGVAGQLGVDDVVAERPEGRGAVGADEEVGVAEPGAVEEGALVDDVVAGGQ